MAVARFNEETRAKPEVTRQALGRRRFLVWLTRGSLLGAGVVIAGQILRFLSYHPSSENTTVIAVGSPTDFNLGIHYVPAARAYIGRDSQGLYALDAVCTHLGCLVEPAKDGMFACPCHGSFFHSDGRVKTGPATKPLRHLQLWLDEDGTLTVDRSQEVSPEMRLLL